MTYAYTRQGDNLAVEEHREELLEIRVSYGSHDEVLGYVYSSVFDDMHEAFAIHAEKLGGKLIEAVVENDDKYETFRALLNEEN